MLFGKRIINMHQLSGGNLVEILLKFPPNFHMMWWRFGGNLVEILWKFPPNFRMMWWKFCGNFVEISNKFPPCPMEISTWHSVEIGIEIVWSLFWNVSETCLANKFLTSTTWVMEICWKFCWNFHQISTCCGGNLVESSTKFPKKKTLEISTSKLVALRLEKTLKTIVPSNSAHTSTAKTSEACAIFLSQYSYLF